MSKASWGRSKMRGACGREMSRKRLLCVGLLRYLEVCHIPGVILTVSRHAKDALDRAGFGTRRRVSLLLSPKKKKHHYAPAVRISLNAGCSGRP